MKKNISDFIPFIIGILIFAFMIWKVIGYILPDREIYTDPNILLQDVCEAQGGINSWRAKSRLSFTKEFKLYKEDSTLEIDRVEKHTYLYTPSLEHRIQWLNATDSFALIQSKDSLFQLKNKVLDTLMSQHKLLLKINAAQFVINLPYSLQDNNASLEYEGTKHFTGTKCHVLKVSFKDSWDVWRFYFTTNNLTWKGYWVQTEDHYSLVVNEEMVTVGGFTLSRKRKSYRTDKDQNILYLRAEYLYDDYKIN